MTELPGPPPIKAYTGAKVLSALTPTYEVKLDAGAFRAVWESVEARSKTGGTTTAREAFERARVAFRTAYWTREGELEAIRKPAARRVPRRKKK